MPPRSRTRLLFLRARLAPALVAATAATAGVPARAEESPCGRVPNRYEEAAAARGREIGIGSAALEGPRKVEVLSHETWTLVYTAGRAGVRQGGGIRVGLRHVSCWSVPQTENPRGVGYLTASAAGGQRVEVTIDFRERFFARYFPWQHMVEATLLERGLEPGETLRIVYGDRSGGSPGMRVQPFDESCFVFKTYVDAAGGGEYLPLTESPAIEVVAAAPFRLEAVMPSDAVCGEPTWCMVRAEDLYGNPAPRYRGAVRLEATDPRASLPEEHAFTAGDRGVFRFEGIIFRSPGIQRITASDGKLQRVANPVRAAEKRPAELLLWGDLHGHTLMSDGRGTVEEFYDFAERVAGLDVCAVTDHAFQVLDEMWQHSKEVTNRVYRPGRFVTFQAYEWSGVTPLGGDHNCYFLDGDPPLYRSTSYYTPGNLQMDHGPAPKMQHVTDVFARLKEHLRAKDVFCIPHYGGRQANPRWHDPEVERLIEIFSEHRRSEAWAGEFLRRGHRLGIIASTDNHHGNPGYGYLWPTYDWDRQEIGMAAVAIYAPERTREAVFRALYDRRVYATTGDRIVLDFHADGHPMGSEYRAAAAPLLAVEVAGTAPIRRLEIKKNGEVAHVVEPGTAEARVTWRDERFQPRAGCYYYARVVQENGEEAISSPVWVD